MKAHKWPWFERKFKPIKNTIATNAPYDGCMFETFGPERDEVLKHPNNKVWTVIDGEGRDMYLIAGWHIVNRLGYMVSTEPWTDEDIEVLI
jgi:hypothetical protein